MTDIRIEKVRTDVQIAETTEMVWEFFDFLRDRYPDMLAEIDAYITNQKVAEQLADFAVNFGPPKGEAFLGTIDSAPQGIVMLKTRDDGHAEMNRMYVRSTARGNGLGRKLGQAVIDDARSKKFKRLYLDALYRHEEALPLYESLGFQRYADPNAFGGADTRIIHMKMTL